MRIRLNLHICRPADQCVYLVPTSAMPDASGAAQIYINNVFKLHGLSQSIICDQEPRFTAEFFKDVFRRLGTEIKLRMANHPQKDVQIERANRTIGDILRGYVNYRRNVWNEYLPLCEFAMNDMQQESIQQMPFFANFGWHPRSAVDVLLPVDMPTGSGTTAFPWIKQQKQIIQIVRDCMTYRVGLRAQANISARTFKPEHEARAGQRAALSVQLSQLQLRCGTSISGLQVSSPRSELSAEQATKNVIAFWRVGRNLSSILTCLATFKGRKVNLS